MITLEKATQITKEYLENTLGHLLYREFLIESVSNDKENYNVLWSLLTTFGGKERVYYMIKVNKETGKIVDVSIRKEKK